ncbi:unnamed protein product [Rotaria sp. Silwood1]|nr:unnamed protein product [Rotaria sp. Silwood1]
MDDENIIQLKLILPILIELNIFYLISSQCDEDKIISHLPISNLKILSILTYLIISLIPYLNIFKFKFNCNRIYRNETFLNRYLQFQNISMCSKIILTGELLDTLKKSSQLSSIKINSNDLILIFNHNQLCSYLNKMIKQNKYIQICSMFI